MPRYYLFPGQEVNKNVQSSLKTDVAARPSPVPCFGDSNDWTVHVTVSLHAYTYPASHKASRSA
ncbi:hypothetical protein OS493_029926 [Desmophyllum pertusum]|uniref:Uncharacterized protein n=1 Tax=Desmophyllum pertusum TaxID=174260 RepID=A0A9W9Y965_9CNID|nr:hypothetical protein OS493_029926 [Desmophyllum pertusum]